MRAMFYDSRDRGFTLIELLVVISIIALLISILMPALNSARWQAKRLLCTGNLRSMALGLHLYQEENEGVMPPQYKRANIMLEKPRS